MILGISMFIFLFLSAFFSGSEIAFVSANKLGIAVRKEKKTRASRIISGFYEKPVAFLSTMLIGNNIALVVFSILTTKALVPIVTPYFGDGLSSLLIYTLIITLVVLVLGEFLPKTLFSLYSTKMLFFLAFPLAFFKWFLFIPTSIMTAFSNFFLKNILKIKTDNVDNGLTRVDLEHFIEDSLSDDQDEIDKGILTNVLNLGHNNVAHCMIPRTEIRAIDKLASIDELIHEFRDSKLSRLIVEDGDIDNIIGYVHHQQLLKNPKTVRKMVLDILYVPEVMNLKDLMMQFTKSNTSIACVVDEFGGTAGIITLEDILEEIFGEIEDEHDEEDYLMQKISDDEYLFSGRLELDHINEKFPELNLPEGEYQTLSGYIVMTSETIPDLGEQVELDGYCFKIEEVDETKIEKVRVLRILEEDKNDEPQV